MKPPTRFWLLIQPLAVLELVLYFLALPYIFWKCPRGNGPVMILPGFLFGDWYMWPMKMTLKVKGYQVYGWRLGMNKGYSEKINDGLIRRLKELVEEHDGQKISLIGFSLGGIYARNTAHLQPQLVDQIFVIGSPFMEIDNSVNIQNIYKFVAGKKLEDNVGFEVAERVKKKLSIPTISIYSFFDGIVSLESCIEPEDSMTFNYEILSTHCGLPHNYKVMKIILEKLGG